MSVTGMRDARARATAVFPTPVGPTITGTNGLGAAKAALQLGLGQLHDGRTPVHVVRRELAGEQALDQLALLDRREHLARLDGRAAGVGRGKPLELVVQTAEPVLGEIRYQLLETAPRIEALM